MRCLHYLNSPPPKKKKRLVFDVAVVRCVCLNLHLLPRKFIEVSVSSSVSLTFLTTAGLSNSLVKFRHILNFLNEGHCLFICNWTCPCHHLIGARLWIFLGFLIMFMSLIASIGILFGAFVSPGEFLPWLQ